MLFSKQTLYQIKAIFLFSLSVALVAFLTTGCNTINKVRHRNCEIVFSEESVHVEAPGKITVEFSLQTCDNEPVPYLTEKSFTLFEDSDELSEFEAPFYVDLSPQAYQFDAILLLDMSGSIIDSGNLPALIDAASSFVEEIAEGKRIAIYTFDGRSGKDIEEVISFTNDVGILQAGIQGLASYEVVDRSTNIYGAVEEAIRILNSRPNSNNTLQATSLIVLTDGTHRAGTGKSGYPEWDDVFSQVSETRHSIFTIGLGGEINQDELEKIGKSGSAFAKDIDDLPNAFKELVDFANSSYIITYCSPARAGSHALTVRSDWKGMTGEISHEFNANNFSGGCTISR